MSKRIALAAAVAFTELAAAAQGVTLDDIMTGRYRQKNPMWRTTQVTVADGTAPQYAVEEWADDKTVWRRYDCRSGKPAGMYFCLDSVREKAGATKIDNVMATTSADRLIVSENSQSLYRHSVVADHYVYSRRYSQMDRLSEQGRERCPVMSPDGSMIAYVRANNVYIKKLRYNSTTAVTTDGAENSVINGAPDWVYEEEFATDCCLAWSPDSKDLAFVRYDESEVPMYSFPTYNWGGAGMADKELYPGTCQYKYPKAGERNSTVSVRVYNIDTRKTKTMDISAGHKGATGDVYVPRILWTGNQDELCVVRLNRHQNNLTLLMCNSQSTVGRDVYTDKNNRYIDEDVIHSLRFLPDGSGFLILSEADGHRHIYLYGVNGVLRAQLTKGDFDVQEIIGYNEKRKLVVYQSAEPTPRERTISTVTLDGKKTTRLTQGRGTHNATMTKDNELLLVAHSTADSPTTVTLRDLTGKTLRTLEDNAALRSRLAANPLPKKEFTQLTAADGKTKLEAYIMKPTNFNPQKQYPLLMVQYSGPGSQQVSDSYAADWTDALCEAGYVVACVDPRGTGCKGEDFKKCTFLKLGILESDDQIAAARQLGQLPYIDAARIAIWGWSYGGFMTAMCLCRSDVFKAGIAIAPVTSWRFYDSAYTERFMRLPDENISGYDAASPVRLAENLSGRLLLVHGTADDNVHWQNHAEMADALIKAGKQFDMFVYPNLNHSLPGVRRHLYTMLMEFLDKNL